MNAAETDALYSPDETRRHACEVREWLRKAREKQAELGTEGRRQWWAEELAGIAGHRGQAAADRIDAEVRRLWAQSKERA